MDCATGVRSTGPTVRCELESETMRDVMVSPDSCNLRCRASLSSLLSHSDLQSLVPSRFEPSKDKESKESISELCNGANVLLPAANLRCVDCCLRRSAVRRSRAPNSYFVCSPEALVVLLDTPGWPSPCWLGVVE